MKTKKTLGKPFGFPIIQLKPGQFQHGQPVTVEANWFHWNWIWVVVTFLVIAFSSLTSSAQVIPAASEYLYSNRIQALFQNGGDRFHDLVGHSGYRSPLRGPNYLWNPLLGTYASNASGLWVGGIDETGQLRIAAQTYREVGNDYAVGPVRSNGNYPIQAPLLKFHHEMNYPQSFLRLSSGKILALHTDGYTVFDTVTQTGTFHALNYPRPNYSAHELDDGRVWIYGDVPAWGANPRASSIIDTTTWIETDYVTMNHYKAGASVTKLLDGRFFISGGFSSEIWDPVTLQATVLPQYGAERGYHSQLLLSDGRVVVAGGSRSLNTFTGDRNDIWIYDPISNTWAVQNSILGENVNYPLLAELPGGRLLSAGGMEGNGYMVVTDSALGTQGFTRLMVLPYIPGRMSKVINEDGDIYMFSDFGYGRGYGSMVWKYDLGLDTIVNTQIQMGHAAAFYVGNGKAWFQKTSYPDYGFLTFNTRTERTEDYKYQHIWKVSKQEVLAFQDDFANGVVDFRKYPDIETWPAHGDVGAGEPALLAPFLDANQDGLYRPGQKGDIPCIRGDQNLWWIFNDDAISHTNSGGQPMGIEVHGSAWNFDCDLSPCPDSLFRYVIFHNYKIINRSSHSYHDTYIGNWADIDIGYPSDDFVGSDTTLELGFGYNGDSGDDAYIGGQFGGYGGTPPGFGSTLLETPENLGMTHYIALDSNPGPHGRPSTPQQFYNCMQSIYPDGTHLVANGLDGYASTASGPNTNYHFPGNAGFCGTGSNGWTEVSAGSTPGRRNVLQGTGPFNLSPGQSVNYSFATVFARGGHNLHSVCKMKGLVQNLRNWYYSISSPCIVSVGIDDPVMDESRTPFLVVPNPSNGSISILAQNGFLPPQFLVVDVMGREVFRGSVSPQTQQTHIELQHLTDGIYWLVGEWDNRRETQRIVIYR